MQPDDRGESEHVVLVDADDRPTGAAGKIAAHRAGALHRAFSVLIWNSAGEMLLQRRAPGKYHSGGLWTNACCGHPRPGEPVDRAAARRLGEELGFDCPLEEIGTLTYRADVGHGLVEHEFVHVFRGVHDGAMALDPQEVCEVRWATPKTVSRAIETTPAQYTAWFAAYVRAGWPLDRPPELERATTADRARPG